MDPNQVLTAVASLLAASIGAGAVLAAQRFHWSRESAAAGEEGVKSSVQEVLVRALSIDLQAHELALFAKDASSVSGLLNRVLRASVPVDLPALFRGLNAEAEALNRASAYIWMNADEGTIRRTNEVVLAAMDVVDCHHSRRPGGRVVTFLLELVVGRRPGDPAEVEAAREKLAAARTALVEHTRSVFDLPAINLGGTTAP